MRRQLTFWGRNADALRVVLVADVTALHVLVHSLDVVATGRDGLRSDGGREDGDQRCLREPHNGVEWLVLSERSIK